MPAHPSIRDRLEADAQKNYPQLVRRLDGARLRPPPRRALRWEDRALLIISALLLLLLIIRVETVHADAPVDDFYGLEFVSAAGGMQQSIALDTDIQVEVTGLTARIEVKQVFSKHRAGLGRGHLPLPAPTRLRRGPHAGTRR